MFVTLKRIHKGEKYLDIRFFKNFKYIIMKHLVHLKKVYTLLCTRKNIESAKKDIKVENFFYPCIPHPPKTITVKN